MKPKPYIRPKTAVPQFSEENGFYTTKARYFNMSKIRSHNTKPEKLLKKALWHAGVRYKSPKKPLPGKPDISLKKYKLVIFVDGTFWHGYDWENRKGTIKSNREFWILIYSPMGTSDSLASHFNGWKKSSNNFQSPIRDGSFLYML
uniref:very short patch repair endonuclease n=1 Tax=Algoriphagus locisalis TaxID=305507 RepID=UPI00244E9FD2|nr:very short patch repair endonuclease [Algoriphagus locisalis]